MAAINKSRLTFRICIETDWPGSAAQKAPVLAAAMSNTSVGQKPHKNAARSRAGHRVKERKPACNHSIQQKSPFDGRDVECGRYSETSPPAFRSSSQQSGRGPQLLYGGVGQPITIYDPATAGPNAACPSTQPNCFRQPFANNVIPTSRFDPVAVKLMSFFPNPNSPGTVNNVALQTNNWHTTGSSTSPNDQIDARIDHNFSDKFRMFARGSNQTGFNSNFNAFGNAGTPTGTGDGPTNYYNRNVTMNFIYTLSPTTILNFNYGFARDWSVRLPFSEGTTPSSLGLPAYLNSLVDNFEFPQVSISGNSSSYSLGQASYTTLKDFPYSHIIRGDVTKVMGRHTLKMGGVWEKVFVNFTQLGSPDGQFSFRQRLHAAECSAGTSTTQGNGFATFLFGLAQQQRERPAVQLFRGDIEHLLRRVLSGRLENDA